MMTTESDRIRRLEGAYEHLATKADTAAMKTRIYGLEAATLVVFNDEGTPVFPGALALEALFISVDPVRQELVPVDGLLMSPTLEG